MKKAGGIAGIAAIAIIIVLLVAGAVASIVHKDLRLGLRIAAYVIGLVLIVLIAIWRVRKIKKAINEPSKAANLIAELESEISSKYGELPEALKASLLQMKIIQPKKYMELLEDSQFCAFMTEFKSLNMKDNGRERKEKNVLDYLRKYWR